MYSVTGWPEVPPVRASIYADICDMKAYDEALDKAKNEAIEFDEESIKNLVMHRMFTNTFIEIEEEVTTKWQFKINGKWHDFSSEAVEVVNRYANEGADTRQVARVNPVEDQTKDVNDSNLYDANAKRVAEDIDIEEIINDCVGETAAAVVSYVQSWLPGDLFRDGIDVLKSVLKERWIESQQIHEECQKHNDDLVKRVEELEAENRNQFKHLQQKHDRIKNLEYSVSALINAIQNVPDGLVEYRFEEYDGKHFTRFWSVVAEANTVLKNK